MLGIELTKRAPRPQPQSEKIAAADRKLMRDLKKWLDAGVSKQVKKTKIADIFRETTSIMIDGRRVSMPISQALLRNLKVLAISGKVFAENILHRLMDQQKFYSSSPPKKVYDIADIDESIEHLRKIGITNRELKAEKEVRDRDHMKKP